MIGMTKATPFVFALFLGVFALGSIPIARANSNEKSTTTPTCRMQVDPVVWDKLIDGPKLPKSCYVLPQASKKKTVTIAGIQKTYIRAGFNPEAVNSTDIILQTINAVRAQFGKAPFEKNADLCAVAASRVPEIPIEVANGRFHSGLYEKNLPYWITENMKYGSDEGGTVNWWLNSPIHRAAVLGNAKYSCGVCVGNACIQLFTSFEPKKT